MRASVPLLCLLVAAASAHEASLPAQNKPQMIRRSNKLSPRQFGLFGGDGTDSTDSSSVDQTSVSSTAAPTTSSSTAAPTTSSSSQAVFTPTTSSSLRTTATTTSYQSTATVTSSSKVLSSTTDSSGSTVVITQTLAAVTSSSTAPAASATESTTSSSSSSGGHTGLIVGVSVVGGVALLGALIFLWMKFGGKRFSDYQDEDADIKWPELKTDGDSAAMQPLPARRTGGAGFDMGNEFDDQRDIDGQSMAEYGDTGRESAMGSSTALNAGIGAGAGAAFATHGGATYGSRMEGGAYHDESPSATNHYAQPAVAGYYDPYGTDTYSSNQNQTYYPEAAHDQSQQHYDQHQQYEDYNNYQGEPYAASRAQAASTSPHMHPYRMNSQNMHQGY